MCLFAIPQSVKSTAKQKKRIENNNINSNVFQRTLSPFRLFTLSNVVNTAAFAADIAMANSINTVCKPNVAEFARNVRTDDMSGVG